MTKPSGLHKKSITINPYNEGGYQLIIEAAVATLYAFAHHSPYWVAKREMEKMIAKEDAFRKSNYMSIRIGGGNWVESDTKKRLGRKYWR
jgi:L-alanine-DL-glutamate epimerase-like enolase superfamily enzyme